MSVFYSLEKNIHTYYTYLNSQSYNTRLKFSKKPKLNTRLSFTLYCIRNLYPLMSFCTNCLHLLPFIPGGPRTPMAPDTPDSSGRTNGLLGMEADPSFSSPSGSTGSVTASPLPQVGESPSKLSSQSERWQNR